MDSFYLNHGVLLFVGAERRGEPLHSFLIQSSIGKNVARASEGEHSVALEPPPNLNTLTGAPSGKTKDEHQPRNSLCNGYTHFLYVTYITNIVQEQHAPGGRKLARNRPAE